MSAKDIVIKRRNAVTATEFTSIKIPRYGMVKLELFRTSATTLVLRAV